LIRFAQPEAIDFQYLLGKRMLTAAA